MPAWCFRDRQTGQLAQLLDCEVARQREQSLRRQGPGLLEGGVAYSCLLSGGARRVCFGAGQEFGQHLTQLRRLWKKLPKVAALSVSEAGATVWQALRGPRGWRQTRDELAFLPKRVVVDVVVEQFMRAALLRDLEQRVPVLYANFLGYDCLSHLRGPYSRYAGQTLSATDRTLRQLYATAEQAGYQTWIFSDHGHETTEPYHLEGPGVLARSLGEGALVADYGPVAHVYLQGEKASLATRLVDRLGVPQVMYADPRGVMVRNARGLWRLPEDGQQVVGAQHPFAPQAVEDLLRMAHHPEAGDVVALGFDAGRRLSFVREYGGHGGPGPEETHAFALLPQQVPFSAPGPKAVPLRPLDLRQAALGILQPQVEQVLSCAR